MKAALKGVIRRFRRNPNFNEFWLSHRDGLKSPLYALQTLSRLRGVVPRECPVCGHSGKFRAADSPPRWDARCPKCGSFERQRLMALYLRARPKAGEGKVIHLAPDPSIGGVLKKRAREYLTADLFMPGCDLALDLEQIDLPGDSVDLFVCSHLLEHVDDRKALSELYRCTAPGGATLIMVPIVEGWKTTYENPAAAVAGDQARELHFGQFDHVRMYGADLRERIRSAGFDLSEFVATPEDCLRYGLLRGETVFVAEKRKTAA